MIIGAGLMVISLDERKVVEHERDLTAACQPAGV